MDETTPTMLDDRAVLRLSGADVRDFLQGLFTNDVSRLQPDVPLWSALLTPQGKVLFDFLLWADGDDVLLDCEANQAEALSRRLALYRLRRKVAIAHDPLAVHWAPAGAKGHADPRLAALGRRWLAAPAAVATGWRAHRLALGVTEGAAELGSGDTLWLECNARELNGVSFTKGCYVGQENTARMHHRSKVGRRLVVVPSTAAGERTRVVYPDLGFGVEHRRVGELGMIVRPAWLEQALRDDTGLAPG